MSNVTIRLPRVIPGGGGGFVDYIVVCLTCRRVIRPVDRNSENIYIHPIGHQIEYATLGYTGGQRWVTTTAGFPEILKDTIPLYWKAYGARPSDFDIDYVLWSEGRRKNF